MDFKHKRIAAGISALAVAMGVFTAMPASAKEEKDLIVMQAEAEDLTITDGGQATTKVYNDEYPGYSGTGFVWPGNSGGVKFDVDLKKGAMYEVKVRAYSYLGDRLQNIAVDGEVTATVNFLQSKDWNDISFGYFYLPEGKHTIEIGASGSWGFVLYDTVTFQYADMPDMNVSPTLCDKKAGAEAQSLMNYLTSVYGKHIITGQQEIYGSGHDNNYELEFEYLNDNTGKYPAVRGFDFMNYNPLYGWDDNTTERVIEWVTERNGIATASWHINVPIHFDTYEIGDAVDWKECSYKNYQASGSNFNTENILDETSKERAYFDEAVKMLAEQLKRCQDAGAPIIFRPLHEAQGNYGRYGDGTSWFWWGDRGPEVFKKLWVLLYTELTETYGLHNLIWEMNLYELDNSMEWYPGDEYVDIVGYDKYEGSPYKWEEKPATSVFLTLVDDVRDGKMVAMAECDKIPAVKGMEDEGAMWLYICPWYFSGDSDTNNSVQLLKDFYTSDTAITLDELPKDLYKGSTVVTTTAVTTTTVKTTTSKTTTSKTTTATTATTAKTTKASTTTTTVTTTAATTTAESTTTLPTGAKLRGDLNNDGKLDVKDAVLMARLAGNDSTLKLSKEGLENSDFNNDGTIDTADLTGLLRAVVGLTD